MYRREMSKGKRIENMVASLFRILALMYLKSLKASAHHEK